MGLTRKSVSGYLAHVAEGADIDPGATGIGSTAHAHLRAGDKPEHLVDPPLGGSPVLAPWKPWPGWNGFTSYGPGGSRPATCRPGAPPRRLGVCARAFHALVHVPVRLGQEAPD